MKKITFLLMILFLFNALYCWNVLPKAHLKKQNYIINYTDSLLADIDSCESSTSTIQAISQITNAVSEVSPHHYIGSDSIKLEISSSAISQNSLPSVNCYIYSEFNTDVKNGGTAYSASLQAETDKINIAINSNHGGSVDSHHWHWSNNSKAKDRRLDTILKHEIFHCLGLSHCLKSTLMKDNGYLGAAIPVDNDNIIALNAVYNPPKFKIIDWFTNSSIEYNFIKGQHFKVSVEQGSTTAVNNYKVGFYHSPNLTGLEPLWKFSWDDWFLQTIFDIPAESTSIWIETNKTGLKYGRNQISMLMDDYESTIAYKNAHARFIKTTLWNIVPYIKVPKGEIVSGSIMKVGLKKFIPSLETPDDSVFTDIVEQNNMRVEYELRKKGIIYNSSIAMSNNPNIQPNSEYTWTVGNGSSNTIDLAQIDNGEYQVVAKLIGKDKDNKDYTISDSKSNWFRIIPLKYSQITESGINPNKGQFNNFISDSLTITSFITKPNGLPHLLDSLALFCDGTLLNLPHEKPNENTIISRWGTQNMTGGAHVLESKFYYRDYLGNDQNSVPHYSETRTVTKKDTINLSFGVKIISPDNDQTVRIADSLFTCYFNVAGYKRVKSVSVKLQSQNGLFSTITKSLPVEGNTSICNFDISDLMPDDALLIATVSSDVSSKSDTVKLILASLPWHVGFHEQAYACHQPWLFPKGWTTIDYHSEAKSSDSITKSDKSFIYLWMDFGDQGRTNNWHVQSYNSPSNFFPTYDPFDYRVVYLFNMCIKADNRGCWTNGFETFVSEAQPQNESVVTDYIKIDKNDCNLYFNYYHGYKPTGTNTQFKVYVNDTPVWSAPDRKTHFIHKEYNGDIFGIGEAPDGIIDYNQINKDWEPVKIDLSAYKNQKIKLKFQYIGLAGSDIAVDQISVVPKKYGDIIIPQWVINHVTKHHLSVDLKDYIYGYDQLGTIEIKPSSGSNIFVNVNGTVADIHSKNGFTGEEWIKFDVYQGDTFLSTGTNTVLVKPDSSQTITLDLPFKLEFSENDSLNLKISDFCNRFSTLQNPSISVIVSDSLDYNLTGENLVIKSNKNWHGSGNLKIKITENNKKQIFADSSAVVVNFVDDPPVILIPDSIAILEDESLVYNVADIIIDVDSPYTRYKFYKISSKRIDFTFVDHKIIIKPNKNWFGCDTIYYKVVDNNSNFKISKVLIVNVVPVNDFPEIRFPETIPVLTGTQINLCLKDYISDVDDSFDSLSINWQGNQNVELTRNNDSLLTIKALNLSWIGNEQITFTVSDDSNSKSVTTQTVTIYSASEIEKPVVASISGNQAESGQPMNISLTISDVNSVTSVKGEYIVNGITKSAIFNPVKLLTNRQTNKADYSFTGQIPIENLPIRGKIRFTSKDNQGNSGTSDWYDIVWLDHTGPVLVNLKGNVVNTNIYPLLKAGITDGAGVDSVIAQCNIKGQIQNYTMIWDSIPHVNGFTTDTVYNFYCKIPAQTDTTNASVKLLMKDKVGNRSESAWYPLKWKNLYNLKTILDEGFEGEEFPPSSWFTDYNSYWFNGDDSIKYSWYRSTDQVYNGVGCASQKGDGELVSPFFKVPSNALLDFKYITNEYSRYYSIADSNGNYNYDYNNLMPPETEYQRKLVDLRQYAGETIQIVWYVLNPCKKDYVSNFRLDDIKIYRQTGTFIPDQITPQPTATNLKTSVPFVWSSSRNAENYRLQVSTDSLFNYYISDKRELADTTAIISNLSYNTNYFWRVSAKNAVSESHWSDVRKFKTGNYAINLLDTINLIINDSLVFDCKPFITDIDSLQRVITVVGDFVNTTVTSDYKVILKPRQNWIGEENLVFYLSDLPNKETKLSKWGKPKSYPSYFTDTVKVIVRANPSGINQNALPTITELYQNYPNPFNPATNIKFANSKEGIVRLKIYNINGQFVKELQNSVLKQGYYTVNFDASNLPSGMYIYRLETQDKSFNRKMMMVK